MNIAKIENYELCKPDLYAVLRNADVIPDDFVYTEVADLAITYSVILDSNDEGTANAIVTWPVLDNWGITKEMLHADAMANSVQKHPAIAGEMMRFMLGDNIRGISISKHDAMSVLSTETKAQGAIALYYPGVMEEIGEKLGCAYYVLPSSIHEVIIVPADSHNAKDLRDMVKQVNRGVVDAKDRLSDNVYYYDPKKRELNIA